MDRAPIPSEPSRSGDERGAPRARRASNHLAGETSPYLLQHASNPVDWYPWGEEACARAGAEERPILLSGGHAACHWCHVMERESLEDEATAALMNDHFVCIKVDREERPDLDEIYMAATVSLTGSGGWPMTVFLTPDGKPLFAADRRSERPYEADRRAPLPHPLEATRVNRALPG